MVIRRNRRQERGWLAFELIIAIAILGLALLPLAFSFNSERKLLRAHYHQAIAMEIIDGEMELLRAGQWRAIAEGEHPIQISAAAATNLPAGRFIAARDAQRIRLEWRPEKRGQGGVISREIDIPPPLPIRWGEGRGEGLPTVISP